MGVVPPISPFTLLDFNGVAAKLEALGAKLDTKAPWNHPRAAELDVRPVWWRHAVARRCLHSGSLPSTEHDGPRFHGQELLDSRLRWPASQRHPSHVRVLTNVQRGAPTPSLTVTWSCVHPDSLTSEPSEVSLLYWLFYQVSLCQLMR